MNQNTATWTKLAASIFFCGLAAATAQAQSSDALLNKLVSKGILTADEAKDLAKDVPAPNKWNLPSWVSNVKLYGDFRGRYDGIYQHGNNYAPAGVNPVTGVITDPTNANAVDDRHQLRYRLRFGFTANTTDHFAVGLRLGSGPTGTAAAGQTNGSTFSANTTLNNNASRKPIFVDLAYAKWTPIKYVQAEIGKMNNAFWFTDMVMDPDYNPEGAQQKFSFDFNDKQRLSFTAGQWVIQENFNAQGTNINNDVYLLVNQIDLASKWTPHLTSRIGGAIYNFKNQHSMSSALDNTFIGQNGQAASGPTAPNFNPLIGRAEVTWTLDSFPGFTGGFPITIGGEYANNPGAGSHVNEAYNLGLTLGSSKNKGNWQLTYNYKNIESAAVWHGLNDDDFGFNARGGTDVRGHQVIAAYHVADPLTIGLRYMRTEQIGNMAGTKAEQDRLFFDLVWAF